MADPAAVVAAAAAAAVAMDWAAAVVVDRVGRLEGAEARAVAAEAAAVGLAG